MQERVKDFVDRSGWIRFFGIIELLIGFLVLGVMFLFIVSLLLTKGTLQPKLQIFILFNNSIFFGLSSIIFITCGIGSFMIKKWARAVMLILSCLWLMIGILAYVSVLMPQRRYSLSGGVSSDTFYITTMIVFLIIYIVAPAIFVIFYTRRNIRKTFEYYDPGLSWADKTPLPVLGLSLFFIFVSLGYISNSFLKILGFFGMMLTGPVALYASLCFGVIYIVLAFGLYKLKMAAWVLSFIMHIFWIASGIVSFLKIDMNELYNYLGISQDIIGNLDSFQQNIWFSSIITSVLIVIYQLYLLKFFKSKKEVSYERG